MQITILVSPNQTFMQALTIQPIRIQHAKLTSLSLSGLLALLFSLSFTYLCSSEMEDFLPVQLALLGCSFLSFMSLDLDSESVYCCWEESDIEVGVSGASRASISTNRFIYAMLYWISLLYMYCMHVCY